MNILITSQQTAPSTPSPTIDPYIEVFDSFSQLYKASLNKDFSGVGLYNKKYEIGSFDHEIRSNCCYFSDQVFGNIREIKYKPNQTHSVAETCAAHPLHTDATFSEVPLKRFVLNFKQTDPLGGGVSTIFPISWILDAIPSAYLEALEVSHVVYSRKSETEGDHSYRGPILYHDGQEVPVFRWRYDDIVMPIAVDSKGLPIRDAIEWVRHFIEQTPPLQYAAKPGDTFLFDNRKVLHGRTKLSPHSPRIAYRAWLD